MCGDIEYEYTGINTNFILFSDACITNENAGEPAVTALCHCVDCQKWSGAAYTSNVVVPRTNFKVTKGKAKDYDIKGASGKINKHWVRTTLYQHCRER